MATRKLHESQYRNIPEGEQIVRVKEIDDSELKSLDKLVITVEDVTGATCKTNFTFVKNDGSVNEVAEGIYARMCRHLMNDPTLDEVDTDELLGKFALVEIEFNTGTKGGTFSNIKKWLGPADGFGEGETPAAATPKKKTAAEIIAEAKARKAAGK